MPIAPLQEQDFPNKATCYLWVVTHDPLEWGPGGSAVFDLASELLATYYFGPYWARQMVGQAWSNQSVGSVKP